MSKVTNMYMFYLASRSTSLWGMERPECKHGDDVSIHEPVQPAFGGVGRVKVTNMPACFKARASSTRLWGNVSRVTNMEYMFDPTSSASLGAWDGPVTNCGHVSIREPVQPAFGGVDVSKVTNMVHMFQYATV